jgi:hypothetical protein
VVSQTPSQGAFAAAAACGVERGCCSSRCQASASTAAAAVLSIIGAAVAAAKAAAFAAQGAWLNVAKRMPAVAAA